MIKKFIWLLISLTLMISVEAAEDLNKLMVIPTVNNATQGKASPFTVSCSQKYNKIHCSINISDGAYIYKDSIKAESENAIVNMEPLPRGEMHSDPNGDNFIFRNAINVNIIIVDAKYDDIINLNYRGCDSQGICYPEATYSISSSSTVHGTARRLSEGDLNSTAAHNDEDVLFKRNDNFLFILLLCLFFGAALNLTPCVLPMLSIYSATIMGTEYTSAAHKIRQNISYILGLALTYSVLGLIFAQVGVSAHGFLQHPIVVVLLSVFLFILALSCAGFIRLNVPIFFNNKFELAINRQKEGSLAKAFVFGALSALITTPCTSAPLAGALVYIMTSNSISKGVLMFLFIGLGIGLPLLLVGTYGSKILSRFKGYSRQIGKIFAIPLFLAAYFTCNHLLGNLNTYIEPAVFAFCAAYLVGVVLKSKKISVIMMSGFACFALIFIISYQCIQMFSNINFTQIKSVDELNSYEGRKVMITVSADWCTNCHTLDSGLYSSDEFLKLTKDIARLRFDLTDPNTPENQEDTQKFSIIGVPYMVVLDEHGRIIGQYTGNITLKKLKSILNQ